METVNIFANDLRSTVQRDVPFIPGAYVVFFDDITTGQVKAAQATRDNPDFSKNIELMLSQIADWNFADDKGKLPITLETIDRLGMKLVNWITVTEGEILNQIEDKKKESQNDSTSL